MNVSKKRKLDMEPNSIISAFIASSDQYAVCQNDNNLMQLQRHLEVIVCLTTTSSDLGFFRTKNPLASQCITHIVNLLLDTNAKYSLMPRVLSILQNLSKCPQLNKCLQSVFYVHSAISVFLQHYGTDIKDPLVIQCFNLLENVTYKISIDYIESHFENLINVMLKLIDTESSQTVKVALRILTNLIRSNVNVQKYICSLPSSKQSIKKIVVMLNTEEPEVLVYALSVLANLTPNYPIGAKLWTDEHLANTFKLIMKLLLGNNEICALAALDLFLDLVKVPKHQSCFIRSPYLNSFLKRIPKILSDDSSNNKSIMCLETLHALVKIPECKEKVCSVLYTSTTNSNCWQLTKSLDINGMHPTIVQWCTSTDVSGKASKLALKLFKSIICLHVDANFSIIEHFTKEIVKSILENMHIPIISEIRLLDTELEAHIFIFEILLLLCQKTDLKPFMAENAKIVVFEEISKVLLDKCITDEFENNPSCIDLFLMVVNVLSFIENDKSDSEKLSLKILHDSRALQYIAYALTSNDNERVRRGLMLIMNKSNFSIDVLSKNILMQNLKQSNQPEMSDFSYSSDICHQTVKKNHQVTKNSLEKSVDSLLSKIEKGLSIKEFKQSEIMDLYEHKIALLTKKEQELQNYIDAKTAALQKADQIMTQYKCRQADSDAEALRLRNMLKEYEGRCERAVTQFEEAQKESEKQKNELRKALAKVKELQQYENEQKEHMQTQMTRQYEQKKTFEEEKGRLSELLHVKDCEKKALAYQLQQTEEDMKSKCKMIEALEDTRDELTKKIEENKQSMEKMKSNFEQKQSNLESTINAAQQTITALEEKNENLIVEMNKKMEDWNQQILELQNENATLKENIKLKDSKNVDLNESINNLNSLLHNKNNEIKEMGLSNEKLKVKLGKTESKNVKFEQDVKMLELLCKRYESSIEKKDDEMKALIEELEGVRKQSEKAIEEKGNQLKQMEAKLKEHEYITGMINQLTSGKIQPPKP